MTEHPADPASPEQGASDRGHVVIRPKMLYVGTPVFLVGTENADGSFNLAPASSYWALEQVIVLGLETDGQSARNVLERPELTVSFPHPQLWPSVEKLADVTGRLVGAEARLELLADSLTSLVGVADADSLTTLRAACVPRVIDAVDSASEDVASATSVTSQLGDVLGSSAP